MAAQEIPTISTVDETNTDAIFFRPTRSEFIRVVALGLIVGLLVPVLSMIFERFFIEPVFCRGGDGLNVCSNASSIAYYTATSLMTVIAVIVLASWQVFRPLLLAAAAAVALWGLGRYLDTLLGARPVEYYLFSAVLFTTAYALFYWTMRIRNFVASAILATVLAVLIRWLLVA